MAESDKQLALDALRGTLRDVGAKPAERVRAAEALLRVEAEALGQVADLLDATDAELLAIARGEEGGTPRERGPSDSSAGAVPSAAVQVDPPGLALPATSPAPATDPGPGDERNRGQANPFLIRAPRGPKTDPAIRAPVPPVSLQFDSSPQNGHDPEPWE